MTLERITVRDFQSIASAEVEVGSFTVFTGASSSGKSAFMRAAEALARNSFTPSQVRLGKKETHVVLDFDDHTVEAIRGKSKSTYVLNGENFTKSGRSVPDEVATALALREIGEVESSFSTQFDKPYIIAEPGAIAAKVLGSLTNVSVLHSGLKESNRRTLEVRSTRKVKESDLASLEGSLSQFDGLDEALSSLSDLDKKFLLVEESASYAHDLEELIDFIYSKLVELQEAKDAAVDVSPLVKRLIKLEADTAETDKLSDLVRKVDVAAASIPQWNYRAVSGIYLGEIIDLSSQVTALAQWLSTVETKVRSLTSASEIRVATLAKVQEIETEYSKLMRELGTCPLCGGATDGGTHDSLT